MTGSAIAIPLLGATGASAAGGTTWDKVAECESGGSWSADTGNGYYGGLQLSQADWEKYGGLDYAPSPDQASRSQQIAVAERILADEGVGAWPTCGLTSGLGEDSGSADVDTGAGGDSSGSSGSTKSSGSSDSSDSSGSSPDVAEGSTRSDTGLVDTGEGTSKESDSSDANGAESGDSDNSGQSDDSSGSGGDSSGGADTGSGTGRHRGGSADEGGADAHTDTVGGSAGRHASRSGDSARGADVTDGSYTVREGDNLWAIADSLDVEGGWPELYAENKETVGSDPDLILPGQKLDVGAETGEK